MNIYYGVVFSHHCLLWKVPILALLHRPEMNIRDLKIEMITYGISLNDENLIIFVSKLKFNSKV